MANKRPEHTNEASTADEISNKNITCKSSLSGFINTAAGIGFALIVGAGSLTVLFDLGHIAYSIAVLLIGCSVVEAIRQISLHKFNFSVEQIIYVTSVSLLYIWLLATLGNTVRPELYDDNYKLAIAQCGLAICAVLVLHRLSVHVFIRCIILIAVAVTCALVFNLIKIGSLSSFGPIYRLSYLTIGVMLALGLLTSVAQVTIRRKCSACKILAVPFLAIGLSLSISRGPIFLTFLTLMLASPVFAILKLGLKKGLSVAAKFYLYAGASLGLILAIASHINMSRVKLIRLLNPIEELQTGGRGELWRNAWIAIERAPFFGHGIGTSGALSGNGDNGYPHNILLEAWVEGGIFGFMFLLIVLIIPFVVAYLNRRHLYKDWVASALLLGVLYLSLEYMKSESLYTIHILFIWSIMFITLVTKSSEHGKVTR